jgi:hypothetical protein
MTLSCTFAIPTIIAPDMTALHPPVNPASIGSGTEVDRWMARTVDRDCGERYVFFVCWRAGYLSGSRYINMDKISTTRICSPSHTIVSHDLTNLNHFAVVAKYHMFAHTLSCPLQDAGCADGEEPEHWWSKIQYAIAKL